MLCGKAIATIRQGYNGNQNRSGFIIEQAVNEGRQKNQKNIIMQRHEQTKCITKNLKKHSGIPLIRRSFDPDLQGNVAKKRYRAAPITIEILDIAACLVNSGKHKRVFCLGGGIA